MTNYVNYGPNPSIEEWVRSRDLIQKVPEDKKDVREFNRAFIPSCADLSAVELARMVKRTQRT